MAAVGSLRVGLVGYGDVAQYHLRHLRSAGALVVGVVTDRDGVPEIPRYPSLEALLPDVDAITIAVPNHRHAPLSIQALAAGKAVFVEKPLCLTGAELAALETRLPTARAPVHVGFRLRHNPMLQAVRERHRPARCVRCAYRLGIERLAAGKPWTRRKSQSGGALFTLGIHALDLARWLARAAGEPLDALTVIETARDTSADFPLVASVRGRLSNGVAIEAEADLRGDAPFRLSVVIDGLGIADDSTLAGPAPEEASAADVEYAAMMADFVRAAEHTEIRPADLSEILQVHRDLVVAARV